MGSQGLGLGRLGVVAVEDPGGGGPGGGYELGGGGGSEACIQDDTEIRGAAVSFNAAGEGRVVGEDGADARHGGVMLAAEGVAGAAGGRAGDPLALAGAGGDAAVERCGKLEGDHRAAKPEARKEALLEGLGLGLQEADGDVDASGAKAGGPGAIDPGVGIGAGDDDAGDTRRYQSVGAGRGAAVMAAGFEGDVGGAALGLGAGDREGLGLGVGAAARGGCGRGR